MTPTVGDVVSRYFAENPAEAEFESWLTAAIDPLISTATGNLSFFEIQREPWSTDSDIVLTLHLPHGRRCNREVYALADRTMYSCRESEDAGPEGVAEAVKAGRIAFLRARLLSAIFHVRPLHEGESNPEVRAAIDRWQSLALPISLGNIDQLALEVLHEPDFMLPQGYPFAIMFSYRESVLSALASGGAAKRAAGAKTIRQCLSGAALAWLDGAMLATDGEAALTLVAAAGHALDMAKELGGSKNSRASEAGRQGSDVKHAPTRALKSWALNEAKLFPGDDMTVARKLARRIPKDFVDVSVDPARLIYDAIREARRQTCRVNG